MKRWLLVVVLGLVCVSWAELPPPPRVAVPVIYTTDLFHPHGDPDDHFDLACVFALAKAGFFDLRGIVMDFPPNFRAGDPAMVAVGQMNYLTGLSVPAAIGSSKRAGEVAKGKAVAWRDGAGVRLIIKALREAERPAVIVCVGSAASVALAARAEPELFKAKCAGVYLNSGSTHDNEARSLEFNVKLDPSGYAELFTLPCPLYWFPCWHTTENRSSGMDGSFYWLPHRAALAKAKPGLANYFAYMFAKSTESKWLRAMSVMPSGEAWQQVLNDRRGMWSTASLFIAAGLSVNRNGQIVSGETCEESLVFAVTPASVACTPDGRTTWARTAEENSKVRLLRVADVQAYPAAMTAAVAELFQLFD